MPPLLIVIATALLAAGVIATVLARRRAPDSTAPTDDAAAPAVHHAPPFRRNPLAVMRSMEAHAPESRRLQLTRDTLLVLFALCLLVLAVLFLVPGAAAPAP